MKVGDFVYLKYGQGKILFLIQKLEVINGLLHLKGCQKNSDGSLSREMDSFSFESIETTEDEFHIPLTFGELRVGESFRFCGGFLTHLVVMDSTNDKIKYLDKKTNCISECRKSEEVYRI